MQNVMWNGTTLKKCKKCLHYKGMDGSLVICKKDKFARMKPSMPRSKDGIVSVDCQI